MLTRAPTLPTRRQAAVHCRQSAVSRIRDGTREADDRRGADQATPPLGQSSRAFDEKGSGGWTGWHPGGTWPSGVHESRWTRRPGPLGEKDLTPSGTIPNGRGPAAQRVVFTRGTGRPPRVKPAAVWVEGFLHRPSRSCPWGIALGICPPGFLSVPCSGRMSGGIPFS